jgi:hypothetical protein
MPQLLLQGGCCGTCEVSLIIIDKVVIDILLKLLKV